MPVEQLAELRLGEEQAPVLVALAVHRHPDAVGERGEDDDHLRVLALHPVVAHERRLDAVLRQLPEELQGDVGDDLDVDPGVVVDLQPDDRVDVRDVPPALELLVGVRALENAPELAVAAIRQADPHVLDRLGGREPRLAYGVRGGRLLDPRLDLRVERHASPAIGVRRTSRSRKYVIAIAIALNGATAAWAIVLPIRISRNRGRKENAAWRRVVAIPESSPVITTIPNTVHPCPRTSSRERRTSRAPAASPRRSPAR